MCLRRSRILPSLMKLLWSMMAAKTRHPRYRIAFCHSDRLSIDGKKMFTNRKYRRRCHQVFYLYSIQVLFIHVNCQWMCTLKSAKDASKLMKLMVLSFLSTSVYVKMTSALMVTVKVMIKTNLNMWAIHVNEDTQYLSLFNFMNYCF